MKTQLLHRKLKCDRFFFAGTKRHLPEPLQDLDRLNKGGHGVPDIQLDDLLACEAAGVGDAYLHLKHGMDIRLRRCDCQMRIAVGGIAQPEAKGEQRLDRAVAVFACPEPFLNGRLSGVVMVVIQRRLADRRRECIDRFGGGVDRPEQDIPVCVSGLAAQRAGKQDGVAQLGGLRQNQRTARDDNGNDRTSVCFQRLQQAELILRQRVARAAFPFAVFIPALMEKARLELEACAEDF